MKEMTFNSIQELIEYVDDEACKRILERDRAGSAATLPSESISSRNNECELAR